MNAAARGVVRALACVLTLGAPAAFAGATGGTAASPAPPPTAGPGVQPGMGSGSGPDVAAGRSAHQAGEVLILDQGNGRLVALPAPASNVFVADPKVIAVRPASPRSLFVFGLAPGFTTLTATDSAGHALASYRVAVNPGSYPAMRISTGAGRIAPAAGLSVTGTPGGVILHGTVPTPAQDYQIVQQARLFAGGSGKVTNQTEVALPQQVALKVRIAEMSRTVTQQLGINWQSPASGVSIGKFLFGFSTLGSSLASSLAGTSAAGTYSLTFPPRAGSIDGILDALNTDNLAHILAEPTLTALSGQSASFIDGGSFPVPVPGQNGQVTVQYQNYGVQLKFRPVVLDGGSIILHVEPTVSSPTTQNAFQLSVAGESIVVPSLATQSASTTVVIGSGQTLAIAGLLNNVTNQTDRSVPGLGNIPMVGAAFRNDNFSRQQQELVILVTPYLVHPIDDASKFAAPDDDWSPANQAQRLLLFRNDGTLVRQTALPGAAGFVLR